MLKNSPEYLKMLEKRAHLRECLPHLYGWKWYRWAREYFEATEHYQFIVAANQVSKSTSQIRKAVHWATCPDLWPSLWITKPSQFWYLYPNKDVATIEFHEKWVKEILPKEEMKEHAIYGWRAELQQRKIYALRFNSGVSIYFKTYEQDVHALQTATCHAIFTDEELPVDLLPELQMRIAATNGYYSGVFTATKGQGFWRDTMEGKGKSERFPGAFKRCVSMYDCLEYEDGSDTPWTPERIREIENSCKDEAEIDRRVRGRFVVDKDRVYDGFVRHVNMTPSHPLPKDWLVYSGVDVGSGGSSGHPAAIVFVAVDPNFQRGRVFRAWRGDKIVTTAGDLVRQYRFLRGKTKVCSQVYDWQSKDFHTIASRMGESFSPADKSRERGEQILNVLFRHEMLKVYEDPQTLKLAGELEMLKRSHKKTNAKDDLIDALRYACMAVPWDFSVLAGPRKKKKDPDAGLDDRQKNYKKFKEGMEVSPLLDEFDEVYEDFGYEVQ